MSYAKKVLKLYYTDSKSDKEYHVIIESDPSGTGYNVYGMNGRRGNARTKQHKTTSPVSLSLAESVYSDTIAEKKKRGYTTNFSGTPFSGLSHAEAIVTGGTTAAAKPATPVPATPLVPLTWFNTASESEFDSLLYDDDFAAQELVAGDRILVEVTAGRVRGVDVLKGSASTLPTPLANELKAAAEGFVLDGLYDAATSRFAVVDGYRLDTNFPSTHGTAAPFEIRMAVLLDKFAKAKGKHVEVMQPFLDEEKGALAFALHDNGRKQMMLRKVRGLYDTSVASRDDATVLVHKF